MTLNELAKAIDKCFDDIDYSLRCSESTRGAEEISILIKGKLFNEYKGKYRKCINVVSNTEARMIAWSSRSYAI